MVEQSKGSMTEGKMGSHVAMGPGSGSGRVDQQTTLKIIKDPQTYSRIHYILSQNGIPTTKPTLRLDVESTYDQQTLELDPEDVRRLFANFGPVESVLVSPTHKATALIAFKDIVSAYFAQQTLHQRYVPTYQACLYVKWNVPDDPPPAPSAPDLTALQSTRNIFQRG
jgi:hypothetical protein